MGNSTASRERYNQKRRQRRAAERGDIEVHFPTSPQPTALELIERLKEDFARKEQYEIERKLIPVDVNVDGPIGILHFGDPHVDDPGTDWATLESHIKLVNDTPGLFAANVGDSRNNWVGRLAKLYGEQSVSAEQATILAEHFVQSLHGKWLYLIGGNHDAWSGADDPMNWITRSSKALYEPSEARLGLRFPNGKQVVVNARHDFAGNSMWNPAHAVGKAAQLGIRDHILICGHKHSSGYVPIKDPADGKVCHCIQVASYKKYDRYAREKGFRDQTFSPCAVTIINPYADTPTKLVQVYWDADFAADILTHMRRGF